jgi:hypothetical protein
VISMCACYGLGSLCFSRENKNMLYMLESIKLWLFVLAFM